MIMFRTSDKIHKKIFNEISRLVWVSCALKNYLKICVPQSMGLIFHFKKDFQFGFVARFYFKFEMAMVLHKYGEMSAIKISVIVLPANTKRRWS